MNKVIIAGGRHFDDYELLKSKCDKILSRMTDIEIVSGGCRGADKLGERYASEMGFPVKVFPALWSGAGKKEGPIRNKKMALYADYLIAFWDGESKGTKDMISQASNLGLKVKVINI